MTTKLQKWGGISIAAIIVGSAVVTTFNWYHSQYALASDVQSIKTTLKDLQLQGRIQLLRGDRRELNSDKSRIEARSHNRVMTVDDRREMLKLEDKLKNVEEDLKVLNGQRGR